MSRRNRKYGENRDNKVIAYLEELIEVGKKHGLSLGHEDSHGSFIVEDRDKDNDDWLRYASDGTGKEEE